MKYNKIQNTELSISCISLGTWVFGGDLWGGSEEKESIDALLTAVDLGVNLIDTAPVYGNGISEKIIGKAIKGKRAKVLIATKCGLIGQGKGIVNNLQPSSIRSEIEGSLNRLQTDYIDIYQCHWPDPNTPIEDTLAEMNKLKEQGKIRYIGVSNFEIDLLKKASEITQIVTLQSQYSLLERSIEKEVLPFTVKKGIGALTYGPLAGGILSGKYSTPASFKKADARSFFYKYYSGDNFRKVTDLLAELRKINRPLNQIAVNWLRQQAGVAGVVVGCRNRKQVEDNINSVSWDFSSEELDTIRKLSI